MPDLEHEEWLKDREARAQIHKQHATELAKAAQARKAAADDEDERRKTAKVREEEAKKNKKEKLRREYP